MGVFDNFTRLRKKLAGDSSGRYDSTSDTLHTTPWLWRSEDGLYIGRGDQVWLYQVLPINPIDPYWEDAPARLALGARIERLLDDLGATSRESPISRSFDDNREVHIISITWEEEARPPEGTPDAHRDYLIEALGFLVPAKALFIGVKLRPSGGVQNQSKKPSLMSQMADAAAKLLDESIPDVDSYMNDYDTVSAILARADARPPRLRELRQLESWYNLGRGPDAFIVEKPSHLVIDEIDRIEMAGLYRFNQRINFAPHYQWIADAESHDSGARVVSVRAQLQSANAARNRARHSQRQLKAMIDEEMETTDVDRPEFANTMEAAQRVEEHFMGSDQPLMTNVSFVFARRAEKVDETYIDELKNNRGIEVRPLDDRQLPALSETLPCSPSRANPFQQDVSVAMLAYAGIHGFSALGDPTGVYIGITHPNLTPCYLDPMRSAGENKPPVCGIFGAPGSGKAQPVDAEVLTPDGWARMGDLRVGDTVIGSNGHGTEVVGVYPQGERPIVRVWFNDGSDVECDEDHLWTVAERVAGAAGRWRTESASSIAAALRDGADPLRFEVPLVAAVHYTSTSELDDPYGAARTAAGARDFDRSWLLASVEDRTAVLRGLLDGAATVEVGGFVEDPHAVVVYQAGSGRHAAGVAELVESLGGIAQRDFVENADRPVTVRLAFPSAFDPFSDPDLLSEYRASNPVLARRWIVAIDASRTCEAQCIKVAADDSLYVTRRHVVTHNTFLAQSIATQASMRGLPVVFINPKSGGIGSSISGLVDYAGGQRVSLTQLASSRGAFDPFRYAEPALAGEILATHITSSLRGLSEKQQLSVQHGIRTAVIKGARCGKDALRYIDDREVLELVIKLLNDPMFALAFADQPTAQMTVQSGVTLVEFDRPMPLPDPNEDAAKHSIAERVALATISLVTRASIRMLANAGGGVLLLDEAWAFLDHPAGRAELERLGREGRSLNVLAVFMTQKVSDLLKRDMQSYLSRVFIMQLTDENEANAAFTIGGIEPNAARRAWLRDAGPRPANPQTGREARWAMALHRDLDDRHAAVLIGPTPPDAMRAWTTNPEDRRRAAEEDRQRREGPQPTG